LSALRTDPNIVQIQQDKRITGKNLMSMSSKYGERFWRGIRATTDGCVKKHAFSPSGREIWTVKGKKMDYLVIDDFYCGCDDFYLNTVIRGRFTCCYHLLAKVMADALDLYESITSNDSEYLPLMRGLRRLSKKNLEEKDK
jgi:predicted nucleic acid-binding Zn finger protein